MEEALAAGTVVPNLYPNAPVTFSKNGSRSAYLARLGQEWVLMADNKEVLRMPVPSGSDARMEFTGDDGRHLMFANSTFNGYELRVDGQKWPGTFSSGGGGTEGTVDPLVSPDGEHIAYVAQIDRDKRALIVDGKDAGYFGYNLQFTADSKHLISVAQTPKGMSVQVDGKSLFSAKQLLAVNVAPAGNRIAAVLTHEYPDHSTGQFLLVDRKPVEASLGPQVKKVVFSPDGKRYAAICGKTGAEFVVVDGKKGQEYQFMDESLANLSSGLRFSADSTKVGYVANASNKKFIVINDEESDAFDNAAGFTFSPGGKHAVMAGMQGQSAVVSIDGKITKRPGNSMPQIESFSFSPDESRYAYFIGGARDGGPLVVDGKETGLNGVVTFSPDSKHVAVGGYRAADNKRGLFLDDKFVYGNDYRIRYRAFTPDSQHLCWIAMEPAKGANAAPGAYEWVTYVDGKPAARCDSTPACDQIHGSMYIQFQKTPPAWQVGSDGGLTFLGPVGDVVKRFRITPSSDTSIATLIADAQADAKAATAKKTAGR